MSIEAVGKGVFPNKVTGTRWLPHLCRAVNAMLKTFLAINAHLSAARDYNAKAEGLFRLQLLTFALFLYVRVHYLILSNIHVHVLPSLLSLFCAFFLNHEF